MTCKDCTYYISHEDHEELKNKTTGWCPSWCLCSFWCNAGTTENDWRKTCCHFRGKLEGGRYAKK